MVLLAVWTLGPASALDPAKRLEQYARRTWTTTEGLPNNGVTAITSTPDGYLWIGTQEGLARFDGLTFTIFDRNDLPGFGSDFITALQTARDGSLWIGTQSGLLHYAGGNFDLLDTSFGLTHNYVRALLEDGRGDIWVGTRGGGLVRLHKGFVDSFGLEQGLPNLEIRTLYQSLDGGIWVGTTDGLSCFRGGRFESYGIENGLTSTFIRSLSEDQSGTLWVSTEGGLIFQFNKETNRFERIAVPLHLNETSLVMMHDSRTHLWLGTNGQGVWRLNEHLSQSVGSKDALPHDIVWAMHEDREGSLWVGTRGGLVQLKDGAFSSITTQQGLSHDYVRSLLEDDQGNIWVGSGGGGIDVLRNDTLSPASWNDRLGTNRVRTLYQDRQGHFWVGTRSGLVHLRDDDVETFTVDHGLPSNTTNAIFEDSAGRIWIGTRQGLAILQDGDIKTVDDEDFSGALIRGILEGSDGSIWIATETGLVRYFENEYRTYSEDDGLPSDIVLSIHQGRPGEIWFGTSAGLSVYRNGIFTHLFEKNGLPATNILSIISDDEDDLWFGTSRGVYRITRDHLERFLGGEIETVWTLSFDQSDGMATSECNGGSQGAVLKAQDGRLWFATTGGISSVDPGAVRAAHFRPPTIESIVVDGDPVSTDPVSIPPGTEQLEIHYSATTFHSPQKLRFRYRLEGLQSRWVEAGNRRIAYFNNTPPGDYVFSVQLANGKGEWKGRASTIPVRINPHLYQRRSFQFLILGLVLGLLFALHRLRTHALHQNASELKRMVQERTHQLTEANEALLQLVEIDPVTGIANHRHFKDKLDEEWRRASRSGSPVSVIMADIDYFKPFNDAYGHLEGDRILKRIGQLLKAELRRPGDLAARYGGEEFAFVLPDTNIAGAVHLANRLREGVENLHIDHEGSEVSDYVTMSFGVACQTPPRETDKDDQNQFLEMADQALYQAKRQGRNQVYR